MVKLQTESSKLWFIILFLVFCMKCCEAEFESRGLNDFVRFENMKNDLFTRSNKKQANSMDDWKCLQELNNIGNGLKKFEPWAEKIVDAWGKLPSGIMDGNVYDFGSFSECFHIERNGELYQTKYCLGQVEIHLDGILTTEYSTYEFIPQPENGSALTFGICLPVECSAEFLQKYFMEQTNDVEIPMPIKLLGNSCQIEEYPSKFTTLDWIATAFLITMLAVILLSTAYDIHCTLNERRKLEVLSAFSVYSNGKNLLSCESPKSKGVIRCLDGIRAITAAWVVFTHVIKIFLRLPIQNKSYIELFHSSYSNMVPLSAQMGVDTFLVISGLLVTISTLRHFEKTRGRINVLMLYFHRYVRLTPLLAVLILIAVSLYRFIGNGPLWPTIFNGVKESCDQKWWQALLHVQNYVGNDRFVCLSASWYLSVDMQLYIISPLIIYLIYRYNKKTICALIILILGCIGCTVAVHLEYEFKNLWISLDGMRYAYYPTHIRCSSWLVGVIAGYIFHETRNKKIRIPRMMNVIGWALSFAVMNAIIFGYYPIVQLETTSTRLEQGLYHALSRVGWSIALCYIIFACHHNYGGPVNWFLGNRLWQPLSRISFSTYMVHYPLLFATMGTTMNSVYFNERSIFLTAVGNYVLVVFSAMIATLAFEMPIGIMISQSKKERDGNKNSKNDKNES